VEAKYRTTPIPVVRNSRRILENALTPSTAEERKTADLYRRASELMTRSTKEVYIEDPRDKNKNNILSPELGWNYATPAAKKWLEENQESLELILKASTRESCAFLNPATATYGQGIGNFDFWNVSRLLLFSARKLESENKLDEAFKRYIASLRMGRHLAQRGGFWSHGQSRTFKWMRLWMGHPQQTQQLLKEAIRQIRTEMENFPSPAEAVTIEYGILRRTFLEEPDVLSEKISTSGEELEDIFLAFLWQFCPWERTRSVQLLELLTIDELTYFRNFQIHLGRRGIDMGWWLSQNAESYSDHIQRLPWSLLPTTPLLSKFVYPHRYHPGWSLINMKTRREATLLTLALIAYRKEHGELPRRLDQLIGEYFIALPLDPWSGRGFGYRPDGFPTRVQFSNHMTELGQPMLWSSDQFGAKIINIGVISGRGQPWFEAVRRQGLVETENRSGWAFPIPE
jgi:hypothetical protein